jgi:D-amino peptidase
VAVKEAISRTAAKCLNPTKAGKLIKAGVITALKNRELIEPFVFPPPINVSIKYATSLMADAVEFLPFVERIDGRMISFISDDYLKAFGALRASIYIAGAVSTA